MRLAMLPTESLAFPPRGRRASNLTASVLSRRRFLRGAAATGVAAVVGKTFWPTGAYGQAQPASRLGQLRGHHPRPIPSGLTGDLFGDPSNHHLYHVLPPLPPGSDGNPGQYTECSTITDFNGLLGAANINGHGTGTARPGNPDGRYDFNVDMRFMKGTYVGADGQSRQGAFGFI
jgi:hypothetical protein